MKVVFDFAAEQIVIEGDRQECIDVLQIAKDLAPNLTSIRIETARPRADGESPSGVAKSVASASNGSGRGGQTLRQFVRRLTLNNAAERIAAIACYVKNQEERDTFSPKEMESWFTFAGLQKPSQMPVAIFDTKRKYGYVESAGHAKWKLTTQGENLVTGKLNQMEPE